MSCEREFIARSAAYLRHEYLPKIRACLAQLTEADLWWRPNRASNSVGNLLLHLAGNLRQWIVCGVGGAPDTRDRAREFDTPEQGSKAATLDALERVVVAAATVLEGLRDEQLAERRTIQGREVSVLEAVYHVVEHFAMHTGQVAWITKARTGRDLAFYEDAGGLAIPRWEGAQPMRRAQP